MFYDLYEHVSLKKKKMLHLTFKGFKQKNLSTFQKFYLVHKGPKHSHYILLSLVYLFSNIIYKIPAQLKYYTTSAGHKK